VKSKQFDNHASLFRGDNLLELMEKEKKTPPIGFNYDSSLCRGYKATTVGIEICFLVLEMIKT
jgi:hypothetical protein